MFLLQKSVGEVLENEMSNSFSQNWSVVDTNSSQSSQSDVSCSSGNHQSLSSREINRARRKARQQVSKQRSLPPTPTTSEIKDNPFTRQLSLTMLQSTVDSCDSGIGEEPLAKKPKLESLACKSSEDSVTDLPVPDVTGSWSKVFIIDIF